MVFDPDLTNHLDITQIKVCCCLWRFFYSGEIQIVVEMTCFDASICVNWYFTGPAWSTAPGAGTHDSAGGGGSVQDSQGVG